MPVELKITDAGDYEVDATTGRVARDETIATRCRFRLKCRRGAYVYDAELGSRFHTITTMRGAEAELEDMAREALQPLIDDGEITDVIVGQVHQDWTHHHSAARIQIEVPSGDRLDLGLIPIGAAG